MNSDHNLFEFNVNTRQKTKKWTQGHARVVSQINNEGLQNPCRAGTKRHLLRPFQGLLVCRKVIPEGKGEGTEHEQEGSKGLVEDPGHVHEIQTNH